MGEKRDTMSLGASPWCDKSTCLRRRASTYWARNAESRCSNLLNRRIWLSASRSRQLKALLAMDQISAVDFGAPRYRCNPIRACIRLSAGLLQARRTLSTMDLVEAGFCEWACRRSAAVGSATRKPMPFVRAMLPRGDACHPIDVRPNIAFVVQRRSQENAIAMLLIPYPYRIVSCTSPRRSLIHLLHPSRGGHPLATLPPP